MAIVDIAQLSTKRKKGLSFLAKVRNKLERQADPAYVNKSDQQWADLLVEEMCDHHFTMSGIDIAEKVKKKLETATNAEVTAVLTALAIDPAAEPA